MTGPRRAVLVLGMHRGGTSALARAAMLCGAAAPATLLPPGPDNPGGFWESAPVVALNDALLAARGSRWDDWRAFDGGADPRAARALPDDRAARVLPDDRAARVLPDDRMTRILRDEFGDAALFVLKDPRIARMLPAWVAALRGEDIAPVALIALRHPGAVARSLARRNRMSANQAVLLWLRHMLDAELGTRGMPRAVVRFDALLHDWRNAMRVAGARIGVAWAPPDADMGFPDRRAPDGATDFPDRRAPDGATDFPDRRAPDGATDFPDRRAPDGAAMPETGSAYAEVWCRHAWQAFCALADGDAGAVAVLDRVRAQFDDACGLFAPPATRPDLRQVTLCAADSVRVKLTLRALAHSAALCAFGDAVLFTDVEVAAPVRVQRIARLDSRDAYSAFVLKGLAAHIATTHVLVVQWDGFVVAPAAWDPAFLAYDYIGARWESRGDGSDVGNGGFSLRSRRLLDALQHARFAPVPGVPEDHLIGRTWRSVLERDHGVRFAPAAIADRFAQERVITPAPSFGFHGLFNFWRYFDESSIAAILAMLPPEVRNGRECNELISLLQHRGATPFTRGP